MLDMNIKTKILSIDDNNQNLTLIEQVLNDDFDIVSSDGNSPIIELILKEQPQIILLDINLEGKSGYDLCKELRCSNVDEDIIVIFVSALSTVDDKLVAYANGGDDYISKPVDIVELCHKLKRVEKRLKEANSLKVRATRASNMAFISMKAKLKFRGLINVSGFHVDPGFSGRLIFSVFNAGPKPLHVKRGDELFLIWFADLDRVTKKKKSNVPLDNISSELINGISGEIQSAHSLSEKLESIDKSLNEKIEEVNRRVIKYTTTIAIMVTIVSVLGSYLLKDFLFNGIDIPAKIESTSSLGNSSHALESSNNVLNAHNQIEPLKEGSKDSVPIEPTRK